MRILVVDDEEPVIDTVGDFLTDCGHETLYAKDGLEALNRLEEDGDVGLVVTDIRMPKMDGLEFLERTRLSFPGIPVILITGHGDESLAVTALQRGAVDYIKKPIKLREFKACVDRIAERSELEAMVSERLVALGGDDLTESGRSSLGDELEVLAKDLNSLSALWDSAAELLSERRIDDPELLQRRTFVADEIPCLLREMRGRLDRIMKLKETETPAT